MSNNKINQKGQNSYIYTDYFCFILKSFDFLKQQLCAGPNVDDVLIAGLIYNYL